MKKHFYLFPLFAATAMILFGGCEKEKNEDTHQDPELIPEIIFARCGPRGLDFGGRVR